MSAFTNHGGFRPCDNGEWLVVLPLTFRVGSEASGIEITLPKGHTTNFASIPRFIKPFVPNSWVYSKASGIHDELYRHGKWSKWFADFGFLEAMIVEGIPVWGAVIMYAAVFWFGGNAYKAGINYDKNKDN